MLKSIKINLQLSFLFVALISFYSYGGNLEMSIPKNIEEQFLLRDFSLVDSINGQMDEEPVTTYRYQKKLPIAYFGEHISFVFSPSNNLKGMARMTQEFEVSNTELPTKSQAKEVALNFLSSYASDLLKNMDINWVKQHDEVINIDGKQHVISGMKVKCRNLQDGKYFWVIVGKNNEVIVFERDIIWNFVRGGRQTEKWLHDSWLSK